MDYWMIALCALVLLEVGFSLWGRKVDKLGGKSGFPHVMMFVCLLAAFLCLFGFMAEKDQEKSQDVQKFSKYEFEDHSYIVYRHSFMHDPNCECRKPFRTKISE